MEYAAILLPLASALIAGIFGKQIGSKAVNFITCSLMLVAAYCSIVIFDDTALHGQVNNTHLFTWLSTGDLNLSISILLDQLSSLMLMVVNVISFVVHLYSVGYMHGDKAVAKFMSYLSLFTFAMIMLVTSSNFAQMFFGWEAVALVSYLLIGFAGKKDVNNKAALKSFIFNRIGDCSFILAIAAIYFVFDSLEFTDIFLNHYREVSLHVSEHSEAVINLFGYDVHAISLISVLLLIAAMAKSAQLGLHTWLPDAMEASIPVSALIHSATMVVAGVFLIARMSPIFEASHGVLEVITVIGSVTAIVAATIALTQSNIKRIISYSTISQLGFMFVALGVSAYGAAMFHLFTHACFKTLLFLCVGSVVRALDGRQDIHKMGALFKFMPITAILSWVACLSLVGIPYFAGYYSSSSILSAAYATDSAVASFAFYTIIATSFLTALYSWRLLFSVFHGKPHESRTLLNSVKDAGTTMSAAMHILVLGAVFAGWWFNSIFVGEDSASYWVDSLVALDFGEVSINILRLPLIATILAIITAYVLYVGNPKLPVKFANKLEPIYKLFRNKYYFDEIYNFIFVKPVFYISKKLSREVDFKVIDRLGPNGIAHTISRSSKLLSRMQTGLVYHYLFAITFGLLVFIAAFLIMGGK